MLIKNKKSQDNLTGNIIFIILQVLFLSAMLLFLYRTSGSDSMLEKAYARKIALTIDEMKPGTEISLFLPEVFDRALKNNYNEDPVYIDYSKNKITVKVSSNTAHEFYYFTVLKEGSIELNKNERSIVIKA